MSAAVVPDQVNIPVDGKEPLPTFLYKNHKSTMGVVVLQEWWGLNEQIKSEANEIARDGEFTTIVPDLYRGKPPTEDEKEATHNMNNLDWQGAIEDIKGCVKYLLAHGCRKVGVTGFCMGGALSMAAAGKIEEVSAAAPFYGICGDGLCDPKSIKKPLQCHFGEKDKVAGFSDPEAQKQLREKLDAGKVSYEFYTYDAAHAFTHKDGPLGTYNEDACKLALRRMYEFFKKQLA